MRPESIVARNAFVRTALVTLILFVGIPALTASADEGAKEVTIKGLQDKVIVRRDERSVPYIEAKNESDLYFVQGIETARDRLWQMDLLRRAARGRLAEIFGRSALEEDKRWRRFGFAKISEESIKDLDAGLQAALASYADGVNSYISSLSPQELPEEFRILQYEPEPWKASDSVIIGKILADALSTTWHMDLRDHRLQDLPEDKRKELLGVTDPLDVVLFGKDSGQGKRKKEKSIALAPEVINALDAVASMDNAARKASLERAGLYAERLAASNNWVISGKRTLDGKAILANDPHLRPAAPGIWYMTHLAAPEMRVSGVTFPGVPGIVLGHNEHIAWGATNVGPDVQDIYFESFNDEGEYKTPSGWEKPVSRTEQFQVRKSLISKETEPVEIEIVETRNGPLVGENEGRRFALRWTARDPKAHEFEAFYLLNRARDWEGFKSSLKEYGGATQNFIYADTKGNIGWYAAGKIPVRRKGHGDLPYDGGTSDGDWIGYIPFEELPHLYNPASGFIVTANQRIAGTDYNYPQLTRQFAAPWRARRIYDLIESNKKITVNDVSDIQHDVFNYPLSETARESLKRGTLPDKAASLLKGWNGRMTADSGAATLADEIRNCLAGKIAAGSPPAGSYDVRERVLLNALRADDPKWLPEGTKDYGELIAECGRDSIAKLERQFGDDPSAWSWGKANKASFNHPLAAAPLIGGKFKLEFDNVSGSGQTPNVGAAVSMRHIAVPGDWDASRLVIPLGQNGTAGSPHWKDQFEPWRTGLAPVFPFSASAVAIASENRVTVMSPAP